MSEMKELKDYHNRTSFERMREMISSIATTSNKKGVIVGLVESNDRRIGKIRAELRSLKFEQHYYKNELKKLEAKDIEDDKDGN